MPSEISLQQKNDRFIFKKLETGLKTTLFMSVFLAGMAGGHGNLFALSPTPHQVTYELFSQTQNGGSVPFGSYRVTLQKTCQKWKYVSRLQLSVGGTEVLQTYRTDEALDGGALNFDHKTEQNQQLLAHIKGQASRFGNGNVLVDMESPKSLSFDLPVKTEFAVQHLQTMLTRADQGAGQTDRVVFEGTSERAVQIITEIAKPISVHRFGQTAMDLIADFQKQQAQHGQDVAQDGIGRVWPMQQSAYILDAQRNVAMTSDPVYQFDFNLHETGVAVSMVIHLSDVTLNGVLSELSYQTAPKC